MKSNKKFYAHDEQNSARIGDMVRIRETRPLSKLKRWTLEEIIRRSSLWDAAGREAGWRARVGDEVAAVRPCGTSLHGSRLASASFALGPEARAW